jgi:predicted N-acetyltransferase YhbS
MIPIVPAQAADLPDIDALLDARFGPARRNRTAYRLRDGVLPDPALSFVARDSGALVGSVQCWPLQVRGAGGVTMPLTLLGPVATVADRQGEGIATRLMQASLAAVDAIAAPPVLLIGDEPFYGRFGFSATATGGWLLPGPVDRARLLLRGHLAGLPEIGWVEPAVMVRRVA